MNTINKNKPVLMAIAWGINAPLSEKIKCLIAFPKIPRLLGQYFNVTEVSKKDALQDIKEVFTVVNQRLSGQQYLVGERLIFEDLAILANLEQTFKHKRFMVIF